MIGLLRARAQEADHGLRWNEKFSSYADLIEQASRSAHALPSGEAVILVADNSADLVVALFACWWAGCVPSCVAPPARLARAGHIAQAAQSTGARTGLCDAKILERCRTAAPELVWIPLPLPQAQPQPPASPQGVAYAQLSSGTTGTPRLIRLSHANLDSNLEAIARQLPGGRTGHSCVSWLPLYHDMGLVGCLLSALYAPGDLTLMQPIQFALRPSVWLDTIARHRATVSAAPNFALEQLLLRDTGQRDLSSLQFMLLGAETVRPDTLRRFLAHYAGQGLNPQAARPCYGLAEATLAVSFSHGPTFHTHEGRELVSLGPPIPEVELTLRNGEIHLQGAGIALDLPQPYPTGDLGLLHEGELYFLTRLKDVLVHNGKKHDPESVERLALPLESAAINLEDGIILCLAEQPRGAQHDLEQLQSRLADADFPVEARLVPAGWLPRTSSGKISRSAARQKLAE